MEKEIFNLIKEPLQDIGICVDEVKYEKEGSTNFLKIVIDKEPYIDVDDCVEATRIIDPLLDEVNLIEESYILDICSKEKGGERDGR